ncbi:unnamed protein product [Rotaria socialis]|uniref:Uncharacterized protein n=1 Tax=Rotaria socialis TaxID=392032 RepID=A0A818XHV9_9BILA|nr:unnamed protein product [Rotaria socialis]
MHSTQKKRKIQKAQCCTTTNKIREKEVFFSRFSTPTQNKLSLAEVNLKIIIEDEYTCLHDNHQFSNDNNHSFIENTSEELNQGNDYEISIISNDAHAGTPLTEKAQSDDEDCVSLEKVPLHDYTIDSTYDYCEAFTIVARHANLSKKSTNDFLSLIKSGLPIPNNMPTTEQELLLLLGVNELFTKRTLCLLCYNEFSYDNKFCPQRCSTDRSSIACIYDSNVELIIQKIIARQSSNFNEHKKNIYNNTDYEKTKDIPFGTLYQYVLKQNGYQDLISLLLHADGIGITSSTKLKMWMLSGSIVELPAKLRSRQCNMVIISIWIAYIEPPAKLWLNYSVNKLQIIKDQGIDILNVNHKLIIFGITGDCPASSLIINFINHNGYFSCWLCFIEGEHMNKKRQYRYDTVRLRTTDQYFKLSKKAELTQSNIRGHLGESVLNNILDVEFPEAIVLDYLHVSLLGHAKLIILSVYKQLKPAQRKELNSYLRNQFFPRKLVPLDPIILVFHIFSNTYFFWFYIDFFNRKLRSIDNFGFVKATEVSNVLFYGLLPHLISFMQIEQYSHLALYVCAMRLLHSGDVFDDKTSEVADQLFTEFYKDHELFYKTSQSLKLHLHAHFASLYETHGSLCNLGCFGQESFIGSVSSNHHGTQFYGDSITHFYNIDFAIQDKKKERQNLMDLMIKRPHRQVIMTIY